MRKQFLEGVSGKALGLKQIVDGNTDGHTALGVLIEKFRVSAKWYGPEIPTDSEGMVVRMLRLPNEEPSPTEGVSLAFVDRRRHNGTPDEISLESIGEFWTANLDYIRPMPIDWFKAGAVIWDDMGLSVGADWTAEMMGLKQANEAITRAHQAALLSAVVTSAGPTDLEAVHIALATFVHTHPAFAHAVHEAEWHLPYGDCTAYRILRSG